MDQSPAQKPTITMNRGSALLFLGIALLTVFCLGLDVWLLLGTTLSRGALAAIIGFQAVALIGALAAGWTWYELRLFRPLRSLIEQIGIVTRSNPAHVPAVAPAHALGDLPQAIDDLARACLRAHTEAERTIGATMDDAEKRKQWLEAVLRDLTEGVIVCNLEHRIVLFNEAASHILSGHTELGLRRDLRAFISGAELGSMLNELDDLCASDPQAVVQVEHTTPPRTLQLRMSALFDSDHRRSGYVLSIDDGSTHRATRRQVSGKPPIQDERPEFYDFDLFHDAPTVEVGEVLLRELDYVVFDTETTGLKPSAGDEIVQIAGVRMVNQRVLAGETFDRLVNPGRTIPRSSTRFHGITDEMVLHEPGVEDVLPAFQRFVDGAVLVAHNIAFDLKFLKLKESRTDAIFDQPFLDTLLLSVVLHPNQHDHGLDAIAERFGVEVQGRHTALGDAVATARIFARMLDELRTRNIQTLKAAVEACDKVYEIRRRQRQF